MSRPAKSLCSPFFLFVLMFSIPPALAQGDLRCEQARDPARCLARQKAQIDCQEKRGRARQQCLLAHLPPPDCSRTEDPQRCEARQEARIQCKDKSGRALRACLKEYGLH